MGFQVVFEHEQNPSLIVLSESIHANVQTYLRRNEGENHFAIALSCSLLFLLLDLHFGSVPHISR